MKINILIKNQSKMDSKGLLILKGIINNHVILDILIKLILFKMF